MKKCEMCNVSARIFCESDQANLCWNCDATVHSANFLVAKHCRTLLCCRCHSLTPWKASGAALISTVSTCHLCATGIGTNSDEEEERVEGDNDDEIDEEVDDTDTVFGETDGEVDEDEEDQVVPCSSSTTNPYDLQENSSGSEDSTDGDGDL